MSDTISSPVTTLLDAEGIDYQVIEIPLTEDKKPVRNLEELLSNQGHDPKSVVRSLLFRTGSDKFVLLAVAGGGRADWGTLRKHLDERKLRMAEFDEVPEATGYVVGAVPPIALPDTIQVLFDESVNQFESVVIGSGVLGYALGLKAADLKTLMSDASTGQFVKA
ncbi:aminoacyl-tRNA deacylase [Methylophaga thiooxydans]|uniref:YbaK / prolyl-tRNA synthetases associated domain, putative n=1 Tax=Methylophaga thiooxydans DMS010 TaxID=637616 RepID=C0N3V6_9GAMM|nr:YbaK/EbsC family protein [Methylophaga thiooxydans]EEF80630.1 YbaK / prolyl-tRNA synthetases associated domain, putative [Methylophaga thiooxydans DMS010]